MIFNGGWVLASCALSASVLVGAEAVRAEDSRQVEVSMGGTAAVVGHGMEHLTSDVSVPEYQVENAVIYQITALLTVDGKLALARQWKETARNYTK